MIKYIFSDMDGTLLDENSQLPEEFGEVLVGCIGVGQLVIYDQLSHGLKLGVEFGHIVTLLLGAGAEAAYKQQGRERCCTDDVLLHY